MEAEVFYELLVSGHESPLLSVDRKYVSILYPAM
jgi:hypothetical protein